MILCFNFLILWCLKNIFRSGLALRVRCWQRNFPVLLVIEVFLQCISKISISFVGGNIFKCSDEVLCVNFWEVLVSYTEDVLFSASDYGLLL